MSCGDPAQVEHVSQLREWIRAAVAKLRNLMFELRPPILDEEGLAAAIDEYAAYWNLEQTVTIHDHFSEEPPEEQRLLLYRIAQEAFANIRKHSKAASVDITLEQAGAGLPGPDGRRRRGVRPREGGRGEGWPHRAEQHARARGDGGRRLPDPQPARRGNDGRVLGPYLVADRRCERTTEPWRTAVDRFGESEVSGYASGPLR